MNNYQKIKSMSINEMAEHLTKITADYCEYCPLQKNCDEQDIFCRESIKQWLEQESEEE